MDSALHTQLIKKTTELRQLLASFSTEAVAGSCAMHVFNRLRVHKEKPAELSSEFKQLLFLLGLMLTTPEPEQPKTFEDGVWKKVKQLLEDIFHSYAFMFWPTSKEVSNVSAHWRKVRQVAMPAFLDYFNTALLASKEQIADRVINYLSPFDDYLRSSVGLSASDTLNITNWIGQSIQGQFDGLVDATDKVQKERLTLMNRAALEGWNESKFWREARKREAVHHYTENLQRGIENLFKVSFNALEIEFGSARAKAFWKLFVSRRGEVADFVYMTQRNIAEEKPLFEVDEGVSFCPLINALYFAVFRASEDRLRESSFREAFLKKRDKVLEFEVEAALRQFFSNDAHFFAGVFETTNAQYEHDLIVLWKRTLFVIEAKASPPVEPFRDPDRAFERIRRAFRSDRGIQKGFDQANRLKKLLSSRDIVELYDEHGRGVVKLRQSDIDQTYLICVTRDNFGILSTDLSLLLEKESEECYPWVLNILDLQTFFNAWSYFNWGPERLCEYLDGRIKLHGRVFATDELDIAGFFVRHGGFQYLLDTEADQMVLNSQYSDVFDQIYMTNYGGPEVKYEPVEPVLTDVRKELFGEG